MAKCPQCGAEFDPWYGSKCVACSNPSPAQDADYSWQTVKQRFNRRECPTAPTFGIYMLACGYAAATVTGVGSVVSNLFRWRPEAFAIVFIAFVTCLAAALLLFTAYGIWHSLLWARLLGLWIAAAAIVFLLSAGWGALLPFPLAALVYLNLPSVKCRFTAAPTRSPESTIG